MVESFFDAMEALRADGWCVVVKCLPDDLGWKIEGARSEYDSHRPDDYVCRGMWCCEATDLRMPDGKWRRSQCSFADSAREALEKVCELIAKDKQL